MQALPVQVAVGGDALPSGGRKINHCSVFILEGGVDRWQVARGRIQRPHIRGERELLDQDERTEGGRPGQGGDRNSPLKTPCGDVGEHREHRHRGGDKAQRVIHRDAESEERAERHRQEVAARCSDEVAVVPEERSQREGRRRPDRQQPPARASGTQPQRQREQQEGQSQIGRASKRRGLFPHQVDGPEVSRPDE